MPEYWCREKLLVRTSRRETDRQTAQRGTFPVLRGAVRTNSKCQRQSRGASQRNTRVILETEGNVKKDGIVEKHKALGYAVLSH